MYVEFAIINTDTTDKDAKETLLEVVKYNVDSIVVPYHLLKIVKSLKKQRMAISCLIDFPMGISDPTTRIFATEQAIKAGADSIDITMPQNLAANRSYSKIRDEIKTLKELCGDKVTIKYILEYRTFDHKCLKKICEIFDEYQITFACPSTGFFIDNLADNLIASSFLHQNSKEVNVIATGNAWTEHHFSILNKSGVFGFRTFNLESLKRYQVFNPKSVY